jgi:hypothetical protein
LVERVEGYRRLLRENGIEDGEPVREPGIGKD